MYQLYSLHVRGSGHRDKAAQRASRIRREVAGGGGHTVQHTIIRRNDDNNNNNEEKERKREREREREKGPKCSGSERCPSLRRGKSSASRFVFPAPRR